MLSWPQFMQDALQFVARVGGGWELIRTTESRPSGVYLVCRNNPCPTKRHHTPQHPPSWHDEQLPPTIEDADECLLVDGHDATSSPEQLHVYDYYVVYSPTYQVPVLYFQATHHDGQMLTMEEVWADVPLSYRDESMRWNFITQQEHPVLGVPCFHIHPCATKLLMANVDNLSQIPTASGGDANSRPPANYIMAWLSAVGPVVGLRIPLSCWLAES